MLSQISLQPCISKDNKPLLSLQQSIIQKNDKHVHRLMQIEIQLPTIQYAAQLFWKELNGKVFAFHGEMGSGKTTFITALCMEKGVKGHISSPSFSLINEYTYLEGGKEQSIFHIDLYRLKDEQEAINAGIEDCLYSGNICFVEWPEKTPSLLPETTIHVYIEPINNHTRLLKINADR
ncbi:MAG: tRNA (adenosine(37)-N6)-threonylcarbamoyltransferase complex ATPase subunit type 1 TsaE [Agriterribacter sp.]